MSWYIVTNAEDIQGNTLSMVILDYLYLVSNLYPCYFYTLEIEYTGFTRETINTILVFLLFNKRVNIFYFHLNVILFKIMI